MSRRARWLWAAAIFLVFALLGVAAGGQGGGAASALSRSASGWRGVARLLEERNEVILQDRVLELNEEARGGDPMRDPQVLFVGMPFQSRALGGALGPADGLRRFLGAGGTLVVGYSGQSSGLAERLLLEELGTANQQRSSTVPLQPIGWWRAMSRGEQHTPAGDAPVQLRSPLRTPILRALPEAPSGARVWFEDRDRRPVVFHFRPWFARGSSNDGTHSTTIDPWAGRVLFLPARALANAHLAADGNLELLLELDRQLGDRFVFDEMGHGLIANDDQTTPHHRRALDLLALQLLFFYALAAYAAARPFGPAWRRHRPNIGSHRDFLIGLGSLHRRLGHQQAAARRLIERLRIYDPGLEASIQSLELSASDGSSFLQLAQQLSPKRQAPTKTTRKRRT